MKFTKKANQMTSKAKEILGRVWKKIGKDDAVFLTMIGIATVVVIATSIPTLVVGGDDKHDSTVAIESTTTETEETTETSVEETTTTTTDTTTTITTTETSVTDTTTTPVVTTSKTTQTKKTTPKVTTTTTVTTTAQETSTNSTNETSLPDEETSIEGSTTTAATTVKPQQNRILIGNMRITGYVATGNKTASGVYPYVGGVAMNNAQRKSLGIKYGDKIYIEGLGTFTVFDCGCKWGVIDVFRNTVSECYQLTSYANVYIVK